LSETKEVIRVFMSSEIIEYLNVYNSSSTRMADEVNKLIKKGFHPHGLPAIRLGDNEFCSYCC